MKKVILFLLCLLPALAQAYDAKVKGVYYNIKNGEAEVTKGDEPYSGVITIPSTINYSGKKYPVTSIGYMAFANCTGLETIYIGEGVVNIGGKAFKGCTALTAVHCDGNNVPKSPVNIFDGCPIEKARLIVWSSSLSKFEDALPWSNFGKIWGVIGVMDYDPGTDEDDASN